MTKTLSRPRSHLRAEQLEDRSVPAASVVTHWNELLLQSLPGQPARVPLSRNMALVHVAMFDAVNAIDRSYEPYHARVHASRGASQEAAIAQAAHDTLVALYPARQAVFDAALTEDLAGIPPGLARQGVEVGREVARQILALRSDDGAAASVPYTPPNADPGQWQPTPPDLSAATGGHVPLVTPFATESSSQFRPGPPPGLDTPEYAVAFNEAKALGRATGSTRTDDQTLVAGLWRLPLNNHQVWNRIAQDLAEDREASLADDARLFALLNMTLHDGLQTSFGTKFHYALWRPITAIQRAGEDGNPATAADPAWTTLHPTTPPYPTYSGNAATIGAACATVLAGVFGDDVAFQIDWAQFGFPGVTRSYDSFWAAAAEQADSRIYGGIHFRFDSVAGQQIGTGVGGYVLANSLRPVERAADGESRWSTATDFLHAGRAGGFLLTGTGDVQPVAFAPTVATIVMDARSGDDHGLHGPQPDSVDEPAGKTGNDHIPGGPTRDRSSGKIGDDLPFGGQWVDLFDGSDGDNRLVP